MNLARDFTRTEIIPAAAHLDETGEFPYEIGKKAHALGLMNIEVPEAYGGVGLSCLEHCLVLEELAYGCAGVNNVSSIVASAERENMAEKYASYSLSSNSVLIRFSI